MDSVSMDHYEKQLYSVFKTFDVDDEEALDRSAVLDLCNALQLDDRSTGLVETLFEKPTDRVTFTQFRNGLLSVLGGGEVPRGSASGLGHSDDDSSGREVAPKFVYGSKKYGRRSKPQSAASPSSCDDLDPSTTSADSPLPLMATSRPDVDIKKRKSQFKAKKSLPLESMNSTYSEDSASSQGELNHDRYIDHEEAVLLCKSLNMDTVDRQVIRQIFSNADSSNKLTVGEFFDKLNNALTVSLASTCNDTVLSNDNLSSTLEMGEWNDTVDTKKVLEVWEQEGIEHGARLLHELGFTAPTLHASDLSHALDEELRAISVQHNTTSPDTCALLLQASLSIHRLQNLRTNHILKQAFIQNNKLKNDLSDANSRAQILALEVDENHACMENSLKNKIKQLEAKHADTVKMITSEWTTEKERAAATITKLEATVTRQTMEEARLRTDNSMLSQENGELRKKVTLGEEKVSELESIKIQLTKDIKLLSAERTEAKEASEEQNTMRVLASRIEDLQLENKMLRDRNDELCAEVDSLTSNASRDDQRLPILQSAPLSYDIAAEKVASWRDEADGIESGERPGKRRGDSPSLSLARLSDDESPRVGKLRKKLSAGGDGGDTCGGGIDTDIVSEGLHSHNSSLTTLHVIHHSQECDSSLISLDQRFVGHLDIMRRLQGILDMSYKVMLPDSNVCESCNNLKGIIVMIQEQIRDMTSCVIYSDQTMKLDTSIASVQTDSDQDEVDRLKDKLKAAEKLHEEDKRKLNNLVKDLENSFDQMKIEYEKCEEYWAKKLDEERDTYLEEQKLSDERLTDLISKISEYEEQFASKGNNSALPTIDEKYSLELQFTDLEEEFEKYKKLKEAELKTKVDEIDKLKDKLNHIESNLNTSPQARGGSSTSSPIGYLWSQSTIQSPFIRERKSVRDYQNPAFVANKSGEDGARCSSDSERERCVRPIQRPGLQQRSSSAGALREEHAAQPTMIHCADLEGQLKRQHMQSVADSGCLSCGALEQKCRHLHTALRQHQYYLDNVQQAARAETTKLRGRIAAAETAVTRLQQRLASADVLVKDLYLENCQLAQHRLL